MKENSKAADIRISNMGSEHRYGREFSSYTGRAHSAKVHKKMTFFCVEEKKELNEKETRILSNGVRSESADRGNYLIYEIDKNTGCCALRLWTYTYVKVLSFLS